jgi:hypothetical protein
VTSCSGMVHRLPGRDQRSAGDRSEAIIVVVEPGVYFVLVTQMASFLARMTPSSLACVGRTLVQE